jgi:hypothetical protein
MYTKFWLECLKVNDHSIDLGIDDTIISKWILLWEHVDKIHVAEHRDQWLAPMSTFINLGFYKELQVLD